MLSGPKGSGKSTFVYHFINYLLSTNENNKYSLEDFKINKENLSYKLIQNDIHPNLFLVDDYSFNEKIKVEQIRNLLMFVSKSTYKSEIKIIFIDNVEYLNQNSSNALLKSLEEPSEKTFYFITHDSSSNLIDTIRSRCIQFKINFNIDQKKEIFREISKFYEFKCDESSLYNFLHFDTPGNLLRYLIELKNSKLNLSEDTLPCILYLIDKYNKNKNSLLINMISKLIENFYNDLSIKNKDLLNYYFINKYKTIHLLDNMKKYNLDKKNTFIMIKKTLENEKR